MPVNDLPVRYDIARRKNTMKKKLLAGLLLLCLFVVSVQSFASAEALAIDPYEDWIWEPLVEKDDSLSTGQVTQ